MNVEALKSFFDVITVILLFLTFLAGAGVLITGNVINREQGERLRQFDSDITHAKTDLSVQQERAAKAEAQIAAANAASKDAVSKVATAEARVAEASAKAEAFRLDIAKANEAAAHAQAQVAEATAEAAKANLELEKIKTPRNLTLEQQGRISAAIGIFPGTPYDLWVSSDSDSVSLMQQIDAALHKAKWENHPAGDIQFANKAGIITGAGVSVHFPQEMGDKLAGPALVLSAALKAAGIPQQTVYSDGPDYEKGMDRTRIHVWVGSKPLD